MPGLMNDWELAGSKNRWVCPSDRHLALRAKLKTGWSVRTAGASSPVGGDNGSSIGGGISSSSVFASSSPSSTINGANGGGGGGSNGGGSNVGGAAATAGPLSETEMEQIKRVLARADDMEKQEQERVGKLVDKIDRMKRIANGNGLTQCMLCGAEFGLLGPRSYAAMCHDCRKYVCQKNCGVDTVDVNRRSIFLCKICSESREMWKKSGAWFYHGVPKYVLPIQRGGIGGNGGGQDGLDDASLTPNWVSTTGRPPRRSISPTNDSPERRGRLDSGSGRRRLPATPDLSEYRSSSPQPRWAQIEATRRGNNGGGGSLRLGGGRTSGGVRARSNSSSGDEEFDDRRSTAHHHVSTANTHGSTATAASSGGGSMFGGGKSSQHQHQWHGGVQRIVTRCRRFTESSSGSEDRSDEENNGAASEHSPSLPSTPRGSVQTPSSTHETHDGAPITLVDTSDSKSIDSGVVRSERSHSVTRPASLVPSSPSGGSSGQQASLLQALQQPQQQQQQTQSHHQDTSTTSSAAIASNRLAESSSTSNNAIANNNEQNQSSNDVSKTGSKNSNRMSLSLPGASQGASAASTGNNVRSSTPDLSSPDDEQSSLGTLEFSLVYDTTNQTLTVLIIRAKNLKAMDSNGFSDPYVKLHLLPGAIKSTKLRTKTIHKSLNPEWNEPLVYYGVTEEDRQKKTLRLTVYDEDRFGSDFLGEARVQLKRLTPSREKAFNVYLDKQMPTEKDDLGEDRGRILLSLSYNLQKQCLIVEVVRCAQLMGMDQNGYSDPYVKLSLKPESDKKHRAKTKTRKKTLNPVFNESFAFPVTMADLSQKTLDIAVYDRDVGKKDDLIGSLQLGIQAKGDRLRHWYDCIKNAGTSFQRWHKLTIEQV